MWHAFLIQARSFICYVVIVLALVTCSERRLYLSIYPPYISRYVCPAYESAFILSDTLHQLMFTPIGLDSMPLPPPEVKKDENRLIARVSTRKKLRKMNNIAPALQPRPEKKTRAKEQEAEEAPETAPKDFFDSLLVDTAPPPQDVDSIGLSTQSEESAEEAEDVVYRYGYNPDDNFDAEQTFYNEQFGHLLIVEKEEEIVADSAGIKNYEEQFEDIPTEYGEENAEEAEPDDETSDEFDDETEDDER